MGIRARSRRQPQLLPCSCVRINLMKNISVIDHDRFLMFLDIPTKNSRPVKRTSAPHNNAVGDHRGSTMHWLSSFFNTALIVSTSIWRMVGVEGEEDFLPPPINLFGDSFFAALLWLLWELWLLWLRRLLVGEAAGRHIKAMPLTTTARSWVNTEAESDSSGGSSRTSRPRLRTAPTRAACCFRASSRFSGACSSCGKGKLIYQRD